MPLDLDKQNTCSLIFFEKDGYVEILNKDVGANPEGFTLPRFDIKNCGLRLEYKRLHRKFQQIAVLIWAGYVPSICNLCNEIEKSD